MTKYNKSEIMKNAWSYYRNGKYSAWGQSSFSDCLKAAWKKAKAELEVLESIMTKITKKFRRQAVVTMAPAAGCWMVTGDTYQAKGTLKELGFRWAPAAKCWFTDDKAVAVAFAQHRNY